MSNFKLYTKEQGEKIARLRHENETKIDDIIEVNETDEVKIEIGK